MTCDVSCCVTVAQSEAERRALLPCWGAAMSRSDGGAIAARIDASVADFDDVGATMPISIQVIMLVALLAVMPLMMNTCA